MEFVIESVKKLFSYRASRGCMLAGYIGPGFLGLGLGVSISAGFGAFGFSVWLG